MTSTAALVSDGIVVHIAVCDETWALAQGYIFITDRNSHQTRVNVGDTYDAENRVFIPQGWTYDSVNDVFVTPTPTESE